MATENGWKQKEFIITMWCPPPATDQNIDTLLRDGYNLTNVAFANSWGQVVNNPIGLLDLAQNHGIKSLFYDPLLVPDSLDDPAKKAKLDELIDILRKLPAFEGYHLADEPSAPMFSDWARLVKYLKERDPEHLAYINLLPTYASQQQLGVFLTEPISGPLGIPDNFAGIGDYEETIKFYNEHLRLYIETVNPELISYDHYHFLNFEDTPDGEQYFLNLELIKNASQKAGVPFMNIVQCCSGEKVWRLPNQNELRWLAYTTMAYGGRGICWFLHSGTVSQGGLYQDEKRMPIADWVANVNQDIKALGPQLMKLSGTQVYHTDPLPLGTQSIANGCPVYVTGGQFVVGMFAEEGKLNAFMIMNRDYKTNSTAHLTLDMGKGKLMEFSIADGEWIEVQSVIPGSAIDVDLIPGGGKLFCLR
ncbi:MAG: hypothetical protein ABFD83_12925 [Armatimonadota bacterium]